MTSSFGDPQVLRQYQTCSTGSTTWTPWRRLQRMALPLCRCNAAFSSVRAYFPSQNFKGIDYQASSWANARANHCHRTRREIQMKLLLSLDLCCHEPSWNQRCQVLRLLPRLGISSAHLTSSGTTLYLETFVPGGKHDRGRHRCKRTRD